MSREPPKHAPQFTIFRAVVQQDFPQQMEVLRWLQRDDMYRMCFIKHDRDIYTRNDKPFSEGATVHYRTDGYGEEIAYHLNDKKPDHFHLLIRCPKKCTENTMSKRFGAYVTFQGVHDIFQAARYLTHETFDSIHKYRYKRSCVKGDLDLYHEWMGFSSDECLTVQRFRSYVAQAVASGYKGDDIFRAALAFAADSGDRAMVKSVMSHAFFYSKFF